jgi:hypothetical protein
LPIFYIVQWIWNNPKEVARPMKTAGKRRLDTPTSYVRMASGRPHSGHVPATFRRILPTSGHVAASFRPHFMADPPPLAVPSFAGSQNSILIENRDPAATGPAPVERTFDHYGPTFNHCSPFLPFVGPAAYGREPEKRKKRAKREGTAACLVAKQSLHWGRPNGGGAGRNVGVGL